MNRDDLIVGRDVAKDVNAAVLMEDFRAPLGERRIGLIICTIIRESRSSESNMLSFEELNQIR